jgi:PAS domain S-box-containing protein
MNEEKIVTGSREFAESIIDTVREPLIVLDKDLTVVSANRSFYGVFKVKQAETLGQHIYDLGNKQWDIPQLRELLETILPEKTSFDDFEVEHDFSAIGRRIMLLNARQIERAWGKERIILLAIEDITERRRLEDLLNDSEERYRRLFETASDGIVLLEKKEGHIAHANPAAVAMLGYSEEESQGKTLQDLGVAIDMTDFPALMKHLRGSGILNYQDVPVKTRFGKELFTDVYLVDRASLAQCNIRDVSNRKHAEEDLRTALITSHEGKTLLETILASMGEGLTIQDTDYKIIYQNEFYKNLFGCQLGKHCFSVYGYNQHCEGCPGTLAFSDGCIHKAVITTWIDKEQRTFELTASPLRDMAGKTVAVIELVRDVSEQKKLEGQLRHAQKMEAVGTMAGGIAHDFNNILNVILGYGAMVMDTLPPGTTASEQMHTLLLAADKAVNLIKRLLVFSRKEVVDMQPLDLNVLVLELRKILGRIVRESIQLHLALAENPLIVLADAGLIEQVLMNLVSNARDAMLEGGQLTITTSPAEMDEAYVAAYGYGRPGRYALISVSDTGPGMDKNTLQRIFEPFFTTKEAGQGTGLGLAVSYGIIKQHDGYIKAYSEPGHGAAFNIYLPLYEQAVIPVQTLVDGDPVMGGHETILIAEDDPDLRNLIRITLESFGYEVIAAQDGEEAIAQFRENRDRISLVLLDVIMPKQNGKEVAEAILKDRPGIKILFTSGYTMNIFKNDELTAAGFDFIHKPFQSKNLLFKVREILDR